MLGDLPSIVPRRNYDIRTQCLKGTCSSSELPRRLACFLPRRCAPMPRLFVHVSPETSHGKTVTSPIIGLDPLFWFSPDRADDGVRTRDLLLGKQACCHCTTSAWPCFFRIRRTAVTCCPPAERGWPASEWMPLELHRGKRFGYLHPPTLFDPSCQWSRMY